MGSDSEILFKYTSSHSEGNIFNKKQNKQRAVDTIFLTISTLIPVQRMRASRERTRRRNVYISVFSIPISQKMRGAAPEWLPRTEKSKVLTNKFLWQGDESLFTLKSQRKCTADGLYTDDV